MEQKLSALSWLAFRAWTIWDGRGRKEDRGKEGEEARREERRGERERQRQKHCERPEDWQRVLFKCLAKNVSVSMCEKMV